MKSGQLFVIVLSSLLAGAVVTATVSWLERKNPVEVPAASSLNPPKARTPEGSGDKLQRRIARAQAAIEGSLGNFVQEPAVEFVAEVDRPGETPPPGKKWNGTVQHAEQGSKITLWNGPLSDSDLRFYFAMARLQEFKEKVPLIFRIGAANYCRTPTGFDPESYEYFTEFEPLSPRSRIDREQLSASASYRCRVRGVGWALVYYLCTVKGGKLNEAIQSTPESIPELDEVSKAVVSHVRKR